MKNEDRLCPGEHPGPKTGTPNRCAGARWVRADLPGKEIRQKKVQPELEQMLAQLRPGNTVVVWKLDRLGRSLNYSLYPLVVLNIKD